MSFRAEYTVEPLIDNPDDSPHALAAYDAASKHDDVAVAWGVGSTSIEGDKASVLAAVGDATRLAFEHGAIRVTVQVVDLDHAG
jgi:uncharacterized protein YqgV (UPF0045/DUF77 family)